MKNITTQLLRAAIVAFGLVVLAFMLWEPHLEGRNVNATMFEIYFKDPMLAYAYLASVPFFVGLYQMFKLASNVTMKALRTLKNCAIAGIGFIAVGEVLLLLGESDDRPPIIMMGLVATLIAVSVAVAAARAERKLLERV